MEISQINARGIVILGCGKMGSAMLAGWLEQGVAPDSVTVLDPYPSDWVNQTGVHVNAELPPNPAVAIIAVKPQMMGDALPRLQALGGETLFISIAAGTSLETLEAALPNAPIIRSMPNTPAAIGRGITAIIGNSKASNSHIDMAHALLSAIGEVVQLETEEQIDAVTGLSGSGPAYVFHMIECLSDAGVAQGLPRALAVQLATATVAGAGAYAQLSDASAEQLRQNVTSPNGTTQAGLEVLMNETSGLPNLINATVKAATDRSKELKG